MNFLAFQIHIPSFLRIFLLIRAWGNWKGCVARKISLLRRRIKRIILLTSADYDRPVWHQLRHLWNNQSVNKLQTVMSENQRGRDTVYIGFWWLSSLYIDDQIGQDCRLPISENSAATGCLSMCKRASKWTNGRMRRINICFLCILASGIWTSVAISLLLSLLCRHLCISWKERDANYTLTLYNKKIEKKKEKKIARERERERERERNCLI